MGVVGFAGVSAKQSRGRRSVPASPRWTTEGPARSALPGVTLRGGDLAVRHPGRMTVLAELPVHDGQAVVLRTASAQDVPAIVGLLAADQLSAARDGADDADALQAYLRAFAAIDADPAHLLVVAVTGPLVVGTLQLSLLPGLARRGALRAQIEAVRVHPARRASGLGTAMITWAVDEARRRHCALVQLTTDKSRIDAHRFYAKLGFAASHEGFKLAL